MQAWSGIKRGHSLSHDPAEAVQELHEAMGQPDPGLVVFFCSSTYDLDTLATEIARYFPLACTIGCTTAGEITPTGYCESSITGFSIAATECCAAPELITEVSAFHMSHGHTAAEAAVNSLAERRRTTDPSDTFAVLLSDGLSVN